MKNVEGFKWIVEIAKGGQGGNKKTNGKAWGC
jgi:hypothetical protein